MCCFFFRAAVSERLKSSTWASVVGIFAAAPKWKPARLFPADRAIHDLEHVRVPPVAVQKSLDRLWLLKGHH